MQCGVAQPADTSALVQPAAASEKASAEDGLVANPMFGSGAVASLELLDQLIAQDNSKPITWELPPAVEADE